METSRALAAQPGAEEARGARAAAADPHQNPPAGALHPAAEPAPPAEDAPPQGTPQQTGPSDPTAASSTQAPHMPQQGTQALNAGLQQEDPTSKQATWAQQQAEERMQQPGPKPAAKGTGHQTTQ